MNTTSDTRTSSQQGFTLIEFSVVLITISLLIGAIFMAQTLIRQSQLRSVANEFDTTRKAINEFRDKYMGLPGDITTAEAIWGADSGCPGTSSNTTLKIATCNGDGNGTIGSSDASGSFSNTTEWFRAFQQLSNSGFIRGMYSGAPGDGSLIEAMIGINVPKSRVSGAGWTLNFMLLTSDGSMWADQYGHLLNFGAAVEDDFTRGKILTPEEAINLDNKVDDGKPGRGFIRAWNESMLPDCTTDDSSQDDARYNTLFTERACALVFLLGY